jgi:hypothetical protein
MGLEMTGARRGLTRRAELGQQRLGRRRCPVRDVGSRCRSARRPVQLSTLPQTRVGAMQPWRDAELGVCSQCVGDSGVVALVAGAVVKEKLRSSASSPSTVPHMGSPRPPLEAADSPLALASCYHGTTAPRLCGLERGRDGHELLAREHRGAPTESSPHLYVVSTSAFL